MLKSIKQFLAILPSEFLFEHPTFLLYFLFSARDIYTYDHSQIWLFFKEKELEIQKSLCGAPIYIPISYRMTTHTAKLAH